MLAVRHAGISGAVVSIVLLGTLIGSQLRAYAAFGLDVLNPAPSFNSCTFDGSVFYTDEIEPPYAVATTYPYDTYDCKYFKQMRVALQFWNDNQWHYYPEGFVWIASYLQISSEVWWWTNHAHGYHQLYDWLQNSHSHTYMTDTD